MQYATARSRANWITHTGMMQAAPRTHFNSSRLIRFLADLSVADAAESRQSFAETLGQWLNIADAITLSASLSASPAGPSEAQFGEPSVARAAIEEEFARIRTTSVNSIRKSFSPDAGETRLKLPTPKPGAAIEGSEIAADYKPYHRFYVAHQRDMDLSIQPLRASVREALSRASPALKQLAALDAALDRILGVRERQLLSTVPQLLEKRFGQMFKAHRQTLVDTRHADNPDFCMQPGGWLAGFCKELQAVLLAELNVRLQPIEGLIEAFSNEANKQK